jgi:hypothetical protein
MSKEKQNRLTYLAIPYTWNPDKSFEIVNRVAAEMMTMGFNIFSPISHSHPIAKHLSPEQLTDHDFWMNQDLPILSKCDQMIVVIIGENGVNLIKESKGCTREVNEATSRGISVGYYVCSQELLEKWGLL